MSATGGMAPLVTCLYHHLADKLSKNWSSLRAGSAYAYILQLAIQHVEEVCLRVLTLSCPMLISMAGLIEGIFAFVFSFSFSFIISISYFHLPVHYFSTLFHHLLFQYS